MSKRTLNYPNAIDNSESFQRYGVGGIFYETPCKKLALMQFYILGNYRILDL